MQGEKSSTFCVQGIDLGSHVAHDEATIQLLMNAEHTIVSRCNCKDKLISAEYYRLRPMKVDNSGEI